MYKCQIHHPLGDEILKAFSSLDSLMLRAEPVVLALNKAWQVLRSQHLRRWEPTEVLLALLGRKGLGFLKRKIPSNLKNYPVEAISNEVFDADHAHVTRAEVFEWEDSHKQWQALPLELFFLRSLAVLPRWSYLGPRSTGESTSKPEVSSAFAIYPPHLLRRKNALFESCQIAMPRKHTTSHENVASNVLAHSAAKDSVANLG